MKMDFSLKSFGPIAAGIVIILVGLMIFYLIKSVNAGYPAAGAISFIITYFLISATVPNFFLWVEENQWTEWVHLGLVIALIVSFWKVVSSLWSRGSMQSWGRSLERSHGLMLGPRENIDREKNDWSLIKHKLKRITKRGIKGRKEIVGGLSVLKRKTAD
jgi:hypothetical protein